MSFEKENFLRTKLIRHLQQLDPATPPRWGDMNVQQMIEHYADTQVTALGGDATENGGPQTETEKITRYKTIQAAINALQQELIHFFEHSENSNYELQQNSVARVLNFEEKVQMLYDQALEYLKRFGVEPLQR